MSSFDWQRRRFTRRRLVDLCVNAKQLVVLSHDDLFLRNFWLKSKAIPSQEKVSLIIDFVGGSSHIEHWDIEDKTKEWYYRWADTVFTWQADHTAVDAAHVIRCIRQLLETNLRIRFPDKFNPSGTLGGYVGQIRTCLAGDLIEPLKAIQSDLAELNDYSTDEAHGEGETPREATIDENELEVMVEKAFAIMRGM